MPGGIRTPDLMVRSHALYPTELQAHNHAVSAQRQILHFLAEKKGFEPLIRLPVYMISNHAPSTNSAISPQPCQLYYYTYIFSPWQAFYAKISLFLQGLVILEHNDGNTRIGKDQVMVFAEKRTTV